MIRHGAVTYSGRLLFFLPAFLRFAVLTGSLDGIVNMEEVGKSMGKVWMGKRESEMGGKERTGDNNSQLSDFRYGRNT